MNAVHIPTPSKLLCSGTLDQFYTQIGACASAYSTSEMANEYMCGFWILYKQKCAMSENSECWVTEEVARGRTCDKELQGLERLIPDMNSDEVRGRGEFADPIPTVRLRVDWFLGGVLISYPLDLYDGWKCGDKYQPPNKLADGTNDPNDRRNEYQYWFIRIYDHTGKHPYEPFMCDDPNSPNPAPPRCPPSTTPPAPPTIYKLTCPGCGNSPDPIDMGETEDPFVAVDYGNADSPGCEGVGANDPAFRDANDCDPEPGLPPPIIFPPIPPPLPSPSSPSGPGGSAPWDRPPTGGWSWPGGGGGGSSGWGGGGGGGGPGGPGGGGGGPPGGGGGDTPPPLPTCNVSVRVNCERSYRRDYRRICVENTNDNPYNLPTCEDLRVPYKKYEIDFIDTTEVRALEDATYYVVRTFNNIG